MNDTSRYSAIIEQMRIARNVSTSDNRKTSYPAAAPAVPPAPIRIHPRLRHIERRMAKMLALKEPSEIEAALVDLQTLLVRCGYFLHLRSVERRWKRDTKLLGLERHMRQLKRRRGRPTDSVNLANHQLFLGLGIVWADYTGHKPTRRIDAIAGRDYGPFWDFVDLVLGALPARVRVKRKGHIPKIDAFVRASAEEFKAARDAPEEYRRRGLLDEMRWLDGPRES